MLSGVAQLFAFKPDHPLADSKELQRTLAALPIDNAFKALDEVTGWLESLRNSTSFPEDMLFDTVKQLEEAALPHVRRLTRDYLQAPRLSRTEENRMWNMVHAFWSLAVANYERCLERASEAPQTRIVQRLQDALPLLSIRLIASLFAVMKWKQFRYLPCEGALWHSMGRAYLLAEAGKYSEKALMRYPNGGSSTSVAREYLKALVFHASSMETLLPLEIELSEKLITHLLPGFVFTAHGIEDSFYWVNPARAEPPVRLARMPARAPFLRFFRPGNALAEADTLRREIERGSNFPGHIDLGGHYPTQALLTVLRHLCSYWNQIPPQRRHERHYVKHRVSLVNGLSNVAQVFLPLSQQPTSPLAMESWVVENVSQGGFAASITQFRADWLKIGVLVALQPDGGENWLIGIVRRLYRHGETGARAGIEILSRRADLVELKQSAPHPPVTHSLSLVLWLRDKNDSGECRLITPPSSFDLRRDFEFSSEGQHHHLTPIALVEHTPDYEIARYRLLIGEQSDNRSK